MDQMLTRLDRSPAFVEADAPFLVLDRDLVIRAANPAYLAVTERTRDELIGIPVFEAFPDNPDLPCPDGVANAQASFATVLRESQRHRMALQRYDIRVPSAGGGFVRRFWDPVNSPVRDDHGRTVGVLHHVEDVTGVIEPVIEERSPQALAGPPADPLAWNDLVCALVRETLGHLETKVERDQLQHALESRVLIEQAKGVLAAQRCCTPDEAFVALRQVSRSTRKPIREVARMVVDAAARTGTSVPLLPDLPA